MKFISKIRKNTLQSYRLQSFLCNFAVGNEFHQFVWYKIFLKDWA